MNRLKEGKKYRFWVDGIEQGTPDISCRKYFTNKPNLCALVKIKADDILLEIDHSESIEEAYLFDYVEAVEFDRFLDGLDTEYFIEIVA